MIKTRITAKHSRQEQLRRQTFLVSSVSSENSSENSFQHLPSKRAQITSFIVVGLVLLGIVGILFSISNNLKSKTISSANPQQDQYSYETAVKVIRNCIQTSTLQSIQTIGLQGGALYGSQGGADIESKGIPISVQQSGSSQSIYVAPGILRRDDEPQLTAVSYNSPGELRTTPFDPLTSQAVRRLGGQVVLPKLCDRYGPNDPTNKNVSLTCELSSYGYDGHTIQNKLAQSVQEKTLDCVQKSDVVLSQIADVRSYFGQVPTVILGDDTVTVSYNFVSNVSVRKSNFSYFEATITAPVRFKRMYNFVAAVLDRDSKDILFDKSVAYPTVTGCNYPGSSLCWSPGFTIEIRYRAFTDTQTGRSYDLVIARDQNSSIFGQPLEFQTIVENRRPVLVPIPLTRFAGVSSFPATYNSGLPADWYLRYDLYANYIHGNTNDGKIVLMPVAYDFDEENLSYAYSSWSSNQGWKADANVVYNTGRQQYEQSGSSNGGCEFNSDGSINYCKYWDEEYFMNQQDNTQYTGPNYWQQSAEYNDPSSCNGDLHRCASYTLDPANHQNENDMGPHTVCISSTDRAGLSDTECAAILVGTD